jgi:hypothetical protein
LKCIRHMFAPLDYTTSFFYTYFFINLVNSVGIPNSVRILKK